MHIALLADTQHASMVDLLCELYAFYNNAPAVTREAVHRHLVDHLLAPDSPLRLVVALNEDGAVLGFAAIALMYSLVDPTPEHRRQCLMKELFVRAPARQRGVGQALMAWIARYAIEHGCGRIDWHVRATNAAGIRFYTRLGAEAVPLRASYRLTRAAMARLAARGDHPAP